MSIPEGWAEFNDANAVIRGRMVAASGTFSGVFAADNVEVVSELNIRGNAVSSYYGFDFAAGTKTAEFVIPEQKHGQMIEIIAPLSLTFWGWSSQSTARSAKLSLYRNGALVKTEYIGLDVGRTYINQKTGFLTSIEETFYLLQVCRYSDFNLNPNAATTYKLVCQDGVSDGAGADGKVTISLVESITVGMRKR